LEGAPSQDILGQALSSQANFTATPGGQAPAPMAPPSVGSTLVAPALAASRAANVSSPASPDAQPSIMGGAGGGLDLMNSIPIVGPGILAGGAAINALASPYIGGGASDAPSFADRYAAERAQQQAQSPETSSEST
jgi:hypothetical protein